MRTYTLQIKVDFDNPEKMKIIERILRRSAKEIIANATLLADKRQPQIALESEDFFAGTEELALFLDNDED